ncbi:uncharacterized protein [Ambystoma mexicanum]|uniref:uncharacterized protein isoform X2 n=1 Tax=Ambystoma mexicanum TaxID=8296 RepID=UPI0037E8AE67
MLHIFIPSHDEENGTLTEAISMLTALKNQMTDEMDEVDDDSWFGNLFSWVPQWMADIFKFLGALLAMVLLGFCVIKIIITQCQKTAKKAIGMKMMVDVEPGWKPRDLTDEEIKDFLKAGELAPEGTKFTYPKKQRRYEGKWIYCSPNGQCQLMTWNKDEHVRTAGSLKGVIKIWTPKLHTFTPSCVNPGDDEQEAEESKKMNIKEEAGVVDEPTRGGSVEETPDVACTPAPRFEVPVKYSPRYVTYEEQLNQQRAAMGLCSVYIRRSIPVEMPITRQPWAARYPIRQPYQPLIRNEEECPTHGP